MVFSQECACVVTETQKHVMRNEERRQQSVRVGGAAAFPQSWSRSPLGLLSLLLLPADPATLTLPGCYTAITCPSSQAPIGHLTWPSHQTSGLQSGKHPSFTWPVGCRAGPSAWSCRLQSPFFTTSNSGNNIPQLTLQAASHVPGTGQKTKAEVAGACLSADGSLCQTLLTTTSQFQRTEAPWSCDPLQRPTTSKSRTELNMGRLAAGPRLPGTNRGFGRPTRVPPRPGAQPHGQIPSLRSQWDGSL